MTSKKSASSKATLKKEEDHDMDCDLDLDDLEDDKMASNNYASANGYQNQIM